MSGGSFDYFCYKLDLFIEELSGQVGKNKEKDEFGYCTNFSETTINNINNMINLLKDLREPIKNVEWLYSSDIGEEEFNGSVKKFLTKKEL